MSQTEDKVDQNNGGILALAEAVDDAQLSLEETGAAQELLALASEASLSSPIHGENENSVVANTSKHACNNCAATSTPFWRKSPAGLYYCNACGLYLRTHNAMRPLSLSKSRESRRSKLRPEACGNCGAADTPMWRKTEDGVVVCNACGLYYKLHGQHRRVGTKRSTLPASNKPGKALDFTMVNEPLQASSSSSPPSNAPQSTTKYSLDTQFHHKFDPSSVIGTATNTAITTVTANVTGLPVVEVQPVDTRKLAYLKCSQGRTALIAPKLSPTMDLLIQTQSPTMPPIMTNFINTLASSSNDFNLNFDGIEHSLQPLLASIVSQKLKEQKNKFHNQQQPQNDNPQRFNHSGPRGSQYQHNPHEIQQNVFYAQQQDNWPVANNQLGEFIQNQQQPLYNQQMIQQNIHQQQQNDTMNAYAAYHYQQQQQYQLQQQQQLQQLHQLHLQHQQIPYQFQQQQHQQYVNAQNYPKTNPEPTPQAYPVDNNQQNHQQFFVEQFPEHEPPLRQLSPFSGIKFDKNLIDLVNLQYWQDSNNNQNSANQNNHDDPSSQF